MHTVLDTCRLSTTECWVMYCIIFVALFRLKLLPIHNLPTETYGWQFWMCWIRDSPHLHPKTMYVPTFCKSKARFHYFTVKIWKCIPKLTVFTSIYSIRFFISVTMRQCINVQLIDILAFCMGCMIYKNFILLFYLPYAVANRDVQRWSPLDWYNSAL